MFALVEMLLGKDARLIFMIKKFNLQKFLVQIKNISKVLFFPSLN